jgi:hypothetical protein
MYDILADFLYGGQGLHLSREEARTKLHEEMDQALYVYHTIKQDFKNLLFGEKSQKKKRSLSQYERQYIDQVSNYGMAEPAERALAFIDNNLDPDIFPQAIRLIVMHWVTAMLLAKDMINYVIRGIQRTFNLMDTEHQLNLIQLIVSFLVIMMMLIFFELIDFCKRKKKEEPKKDIEQVDPNQLENFIFIGQEDQKVADVLRSYGYHAGAGAQAPSMMEKESRLHQDKGTSKDGMSTNGAASITTRFACKSCKV